MTETATIEKTLVIIKPDAMMRGIVGEVISRFERAGLKIIAMKMIAPDEKHFHEHYEGISKLISRWGQDVYETVLGQMTDGPVIAFVLEGIEAVAYVRKIVGTTDPKESLPGTIRGDYTHITKDYANPRKLPIPNIVHASGNAEEAAKEVALWFGKDELYENYEIVHGPIVRGHLVNKKK